MGQEVTILTDGQRQTFSSREAIDQFASAMKEASRIEEIRSCVEITVHQVAGILRDTDGTLKLQPGTGIVWHMDDHLKDSSVTTDHSIIDSNRKLIVFRYSRGNEMMTVRYDSTIGRVASINVSRSATFGLKLLLLPEFEKADFSRLHEVSEQHWTYTESQDDPEKIHGVSTDEARTADFTPVEYLPVPEVRDDASLNTAEVHVWASAWTI